MFQRCVLPSGRRTSTEAWKRADVTSIAGRVSAFVPRRGQAELLQRARPALVLLTVGALRVIEVVQPAARGQGGVGLQ